MALAGMILTKETWVIHVGCLFLAGICVFLAEILQPCRRTFLRLEPDLPHAPPRLDENAADGPPPVPRQSWVTLPESRGLLARGREAFPRQRWSALDLLAVAGTVVALVVFFYSGNFVLFDPANLPHDKAGAHPNALTWFANIFNAYTPWGHKADDGEGHSKPFFYWCRLIVRNEPWAVLGVLAALRYAVPAIARDRRQWRGVGLALAVVCAGGIAGYCGWTNTPWPLSSENIKETALAVGWWSVASLSLVAAVACVALPPPAERFLRFYSLLAIGACLGAFALPAVQTNAWLLGIAVVGAAAGTASLALPAPEDWRVRWLAIYGLGTLVAYSIIHYKTPWCIISLLWPFFFTGGAALSELAAEGWATGREVAMCLGAAASAWSAGFALDLNFRRPTDDSQDYVYVQSFDDVWTVTNYLLDEARADPTFKQQDGVILCDSTYPLPWLLGEFAHIGYYANNNSPASPDGYRVDFLLVTDKRVDEVESKLDADYYKQPIRLRPALEGLQLYLRASRFAHQMPNDREPEFHPVPEAPAVPMPDPNPPPSMQTPVPEDDGPSAAPGS